jgi:predicted MPP superfamily phosphohydrolase
MRWLFFSPVVFIVYGGICFYIGIRLFGLLTCFLPALKAVVFWPIFSLLCLLLIFSGFIPHKLNFLRKAGSYWMAVIMYLLILLALADFVRLFINLFFNKKINNLMIYSTGAAFLLCFILIIFGVFHARSIKTANYNLTLPGTGTGIRIVLISDTHIGSAINEKWIKRVVDKINITEPDIVCLAGDIFDGNIDSIKDLSKVISELKRIKTPLGVFAVLGNHDVDRMAFRNNSTERITGILKDSNIILLQDEVFTIRENLFLAGRKDARPIGMNAPDNGTSLRKTPEELFLDINLNSGTIILIDHQPTQFPQLEKAGVDLVLSGHTHKGQIFPGSLVTKNMFKKMGATHYGYWQGGAVSGKRMQAIVTSGAAYWGPPLRIGTNSEVAVIDVRFE